MNSEFSEQEWEVMDEMYFVVPHSDLAENVSLEMGVLNTVLGYLMKRELVDQFAFDTASHDFVRLDERKLEALENYAYLANKNGLLAHNKMI